MNQTDNRYKLLYGLTLTKPNEIFKTINESRNACKKTISCLYLARPIYINSFANMALQARKIAVTCKPLFHQGRGVPLYCI